MSIHTGTMLPHYSTMEALNREYIRSLELNAWFYDENKERFNNSILGTGYFYSNLGNNEVFGNVHAAYMSMQNPLLTDELPVQLKIVLGAAYATKKYDPENNPFNIALGSHLNAYGRISLIGKITLIEDKWILRPGISFHHLSNGKVVSPNLGINMLTFHTGLEFSSTHKHSGKLVLSRDKETKERNCFSFTIAPGVKQVHKSKEFQIFTSSLIFDYGYRYLPQSSIGLGIDFFYNDSWSYFPYKSAERDESPLPFQSAIHLSLQRDIGPISFILHPGLYIYRPSMDIPSFTGRLGVKYSMENNLSLQFSIKHHWFALADYFEWGIGYEINR
ncbi:MAG: acyloxyacyl hydrolase [Bacteroidales bacterium]